MILSGCLTSDRVVQAAPAPVILAPPDALLADCPPLFAGPYNTIRDLNAGRTVAEAARNACNADKQALRRWKAESVAAIE